MKYAKDGSAAPSPDQGKAIVLTKAKDPDWCKLVDEAALQNWMLSIPIGKTRTAVVRGEFGHELPQMNVTRVVVRRESTEWYRLIEQDGRTICRRWHDVPILVSKP